MNDDDMTVFLVDDDSAVRDSLTLLLEQDGLAVESYACAEEFLDGWQQGRIGCAVIDLRMPGMDGMRLMEEMSDRGILLPIVFLTGHGNIPTSVRAIKSGAVDFLTKPVPAAQLLAAIRSALALAAEARRQAEISRDAASLLARLTGREHEVMDLAIKGLSSKEIARELGISHRTVEIYKARVMQKTGADTMFDLAHLANEARGSIGERQKPPRMTNNQP